MTERKRLIRRLDEDELDDELRPIKETKDDGYTPASEVIDRFFELHAGAPDDGTRVVASAGLVIAEQIAELTSAIHTLTFLLIDNRHADDAEQPR